MEMKFSPSSLLFLISCLSRQAVTASFSPAPSAPALTPTTGSSTVMNKMLSSTNNNHVSPSTSMASSSLVPPLPQLRMRCPNTYLRRSSNHEPGKHTTRRRPSQSTAFTEISSPAFLPSTRQPVLSKILNFHPWRQGRHFCELGRRGNNVFSLQAHGKEKSAYLEDNDPLLEDFNGNLEQVLLANAELQVDAAVSLMERGDLATEINIETNDDASTLKLWGIPVQSIVLLNLVAVIWGTQHAVIKSVVDNSTIDLFRSVGAIVEIVFMPILKWLEVHEIFRLELLQTGFIGMSENSGGGDATAAYFTLARFALAALLASPYTPGWNDVIHGVKAKFLRIREEGMQYDAPESGEIGSQDDANESSHSNLNERTLTTDENRDLALNVDDNSVNLAWRYGIELGVYMFLGYAFQAIGLETTTASRSGFLLYLNVKLVPFIKFLIFGKSIRKSTWISALVAFAGTALLSLDNDASALAPAAAGGLDDAGLNISISAGDLWSIAAAAASAMFILRMEEASKSVPNSAELNAANLWTVAILSLLWTTGASWNSIHDIQIGVISQSLAEDLTFVSALVQSLHKTFQQTIYTIVMHPLPLLYLSGVTTALASYIQSKAQKDVTAERASVIYAMDPVYGAFFAHLLLGEQLGGWGWVGASLIVVAAATNAIWDFGGESDVEDVAKEKS
ncbi:hypothetical protein ACHAXS_002490 [Conticribra weissflogii]